LVFGLRPHARAGLGPQARQPPVANQQRRQRLTPAQAAAAEVQGVVDGPWHPSPVVSFCPLSPGGLFRRGPSRMEALGGFISRIWKHVPRTGLGWSPYRGELQLACQPTL